MNRKTFAHEMQAQTNPMLLERNISQAEEPSLPWIRIINTLPVPRLRDPRLELPTRLCPCDLDSQLESYSLEWIGSHRCLGGFYLPLSGLDSVRFDWTELGWGLACPSDLESQLKRDSLEWIGSHSCWITGQVLLATAWLGLDSILFL